MNYQEFSKLIQKEKCTNCGSPMLYWFSDVRVNSGVVDGRLRANEVEPVFVLGCEDCSETLVEVKGADVAEFLNQSRL